MRFGEGEGGRGRKLGTINDDDDNDDLMMMGNSSTPTVLHHTA